MQTLGLLYCSFRDKDISKAALYNSEYLLEAYAIGDSLKVVIGLLDKATILNRNGNAKVAISVLDTALSIVQNNSFTNELKFVYNSYILSYCILGRYDLALGYSFKSLEARKITGDSMQLSVAYNNIGSAYEDLRNYKKAQEFYKKGYEIKVRNNLRFGLVLSMANIANTYYYLKDYNKSMEYVQNAKVHCKEGCDAFESWHLNRAGGLACLGLERLDSADIYFANANFLSKELGDNELLATAYVRQAETMMRMKKVDKALLYLDTADSKIQKIDALPIHMDMYDIYYQLFKIRKNFAKSLEYKEKYSALKERIFGDSIINNLIAINASYDQQTNVDTIDAQKELLSIKEQRASLQETISIILIILAVLLGVILVLSWRNISIKKKINSMLDQKVRSRTRELEESYRQLEKVSVEQQENINSFSKKVQSGMATLKGIAQVAKMDTDDQKALSYISKIESEAEKLSNINHN